MTTTTTTILLNDIYIAIQGEGVQTGVPMIIVRLHVCPVACVFCDTVETWTPLAQFKRETIAEVLGTSPKWCETSPLEILTYIQHHIVPADRHQPGPGWILLTGGEPAGQDLEELIKTFQAGGYQVAIETSGTALGHLDAAGRSYADWTCVSPKINNPGKQPLLTPAIQAADELKFVIGKASDIDRIDTFLAEHRPLKADVTIALQPMSAQKKATELCIEACQERGYRLSVQVHKTLDIR